jgi:hypothetical protein
MTYIRSDFAEQLACALFPLLLLAALRIAELYDDSAPSLSSIALFALPFAGAWLSNAPAGVLASYSMALLFVWAALTQRSWRIALRGVAGLALGFGLTGLYLLPAAYEQRWVNIGQALSSGLLPSQNFLFTRIDDPEHTWFNWIASLCALLLILLLAATALASRRFAATGNATSRVRKTWTALLVMGTAACLLMLRFAAPLWNDLPKLRFVQFPWRWMSIVALLCACFLASTMEKRRSWLWFVLVLALSVPLAWFLVTNGWWDTDEMPTQAGAITTGNGFDGTDEYDPLGDDHLDLPLNSPPVRIVSINKEESLPPGTAIHIVKWTTEEKELRVDARTEGLVVLRLLNYPSWQVEVNGKRIQPERLDDINQMVVPVDSGHSEIRVRFARTPDRTVGIILSVLSVLITLLLLLSSGKRRPPRQ